MPFHLSLCFRPVTPTEYGKRRHVSSASISSFDADMLDPRIFCHELPMPKYVEIQKHTLFIVSAMHRCIKKLFYFMKMNNYIYI